MGKKCDRIIRRGLLLLELKITRKLFRDRLLLLKVAGQPPRHASCCCGTLRLQCNIFRSEIFSPKYQSAYIISRLAESS